MKVRFTRAARNEVVRIYDHLAAESPSARVGFEERLSQILRNVADFPETGRATSHPIVRVRNTFPYPYLVFYRIGATEIVVIRVLHGARDPRTMPARPR